MTRNIDCEIVADSINPNQNRLCSYIVTLPRFIWSEFLTHRQVSRNAASSRAIPVKKMIKMLREGGAHPEFWGSNKPGMQANEQLTGDDMKEARRLWDEAKMNAIDSSEKMMEVGLHKQISNRILEAWCPYKALVSATEWKNFFGLRAHPDAQPEFQVLAYRMLDAYLNSTPAELEWGEWHIPFGDQMPEGLDLDTMLRVAIARAARLSYLTFDGLMDIAKDLALYEQLMVSEPLHASPAEHVAKAAPSLWYHFENDTPAKTITSGGFQTVSSSSDEAESKHSLILPYDDEGNHQGNFVGFTQYRKLQPNECIRDIDLEAVMSNKPAWVDL